MSKGKGYYFPPCHILHLGGFTLLVDCPLDLSALAAFAPVPYGCSVNHDQGGVGNEDPSVERPVDASGFIHAEPWYKTVATLHLWDIASIDVVLISSPMGILGLPFLVRADGFSAKVIIKRWYFRIMVVEEAQSLCIHALLVCCLECLSC